MLCCTIAQNLELPDFFLLTGRPLQRAQFFDHIPPRHDPVQANVKHSCFVLLSLKCRIKGRILLLYYYKNKFLFL
jgi:hypothetical protein